MTLCCDGGRGERRGEEMQNDEGHHPPAPANTCLVSQVKSTAVQAPEPNPVASLNVQARGAGVCGLCNALLREGGSGWT